MKKSIIIIIIAVVTVICVYAAKYLDKPVETVSARVTEYEESTTADAYLVREESVYTAEKSGTFYTYESEGARVGKNRLIATVYDGIVDSQSLQEINNLNKKIAEIEEYEKNNGFMKDNSDSETRLKNLKNEIISAAEKKDVSQMSKIKSGIKEIVSGVETETASESAEELQRRKNTAEAGLGKSKADIYSDCSGVFSTIIDGLENELTVDGLDGYTLEDFDALAEKDIETSAKSTVLSGEAVCKVTDNHTWYVMAKTDNSLNLKKDQTVILRFDSIPGVEAEANVLRVAANDESGESLVIFECEKYIEGIFSLRQSSIEIVAKSYSGYKIPISALRVKEDGTQGVMVKYGVNEIFKPCEVIFTNKTDDTVIINAVTDGVANPLEQFDKIVIGEKTET